MSRNEEMRQVLDGAPVAAFLRAHAGDEPLEQLDLLVREQAHLDHAVVFRPLDGPGALDETGGSHRVQGYQILCGWMFGLPRPRCVTRAPLAFGGRVRTVDVQRASSEAERRATSGSPRPSSPRASRGPSRPPPA